MVVSIGVPWSAKHKRVTKHGAVPYNLSNSFAQPLTSQELIQWTKDRNDDELLQLYHSHALTYTPNGGSHDLKKDIADLYGDDTTADDILVFAGGQVAIQTAAFAICNPDSHAIVFTPSYQSLQEGPKAAGSQVTYIPLRAKNGWTVDPKDVEDAIIPNKTNYIVLNEPYNPAGTLMTRDVQKQIIDIASKHGIHILCDEVYRLLEHNPTTDRLPAMCDAYPRLGLSVVTMSKPWGACGVTIGWIACQNNPDLMARISNVQYFGTACPSRISEIQAMMVLRSSETILQRNIAIIRRNLKVLKQFMERNNDLFEWIPPNAGAIAFIKFKGPLTSDELGNVLVEEAGIGIKPAYCFSGDDNVTEDVDYFRVGYGEDCIPTAISKLQEFVDRHRDQWLSENRKRKRDRDKHRDEI
jgi:aspartate/methionine/tyrosine aminotransferase